MRVFLFSFLFGFLFLSCGRETLPYSTKFLETGEGSLHSLARWSTEELFRESKGRVRTNAILVLHKGKIRMEAYFSEFGPETLHPTWSISKFLLNGALAEAIASGKMELDGSVVDYLKDPNVSFRKDLKVKDLLFFASGLDWKERYEWAPLDSDILEILYGDARSDIARYISKLGFSYEPGEHVAYSSGDSNLLSAVLTRIVGKDYSDKYLRSVGIHSFVWETDGKEVPIASSYAYLSARDLAHLGEFYIREGWGQHPSGLFPKDWIADTFRVHDPRKHRPWYLSWLPFPPMGGHVYVNRFDSVTDKLFFANLSADAFFASGHWGQYMVVDPKLDLVVVRFGNDRGGKFPMKDFIDRLLPGLEE
ncbi:class C beta-lactamase-related serine hydrolase [Leptospira langatensis]|uniref:Class C beta-lactamase-related serine hydrolase n=1 Tax=Leptospira langatensis TaxID=2484983 RepID=A0A5F1ZQD1_9LEPT|nr:serine hydrolase [Leptospira langatensis]TGK05106.1 class C beta-lactamase-related serine hydrolase [Leptospira langatensis]TGL38242.1 class C beta-lactamase-related serine hydrolase [Leptospira langatensis]